MPPDTDSEDAYKRAKRARLAEITSSGSEADNSEDEFMRLQEEDARWAALEHLHQHQAEDQGSQQEGAAGSASEDDAMPDAHPDMDLEMLGRC